MLAARAAHKARENDANLGDLPLGHSRIGGVPDSKRRAVGDGE